MANDLVAAVALAVAAQARVFSALSPSHGQIERGERKRETSRKAHIKTVVSTGNSELERLLLFYNKEKVLSQANPSKFFYGHQRICGSRVTQGISVLYISAQSWLAVPATRQK